ncbi:MAG: helix-turn-helix transcriptional regulator [Desulfohalobiaceae bacterium]|nr:helix-turn-helix transcriptional regulator [Desulfohalobiaceae bacterium]
MDNGLYINSKKFSRQARLNAWLSLHGIAKNELARKTGFSPSYISFLLNGKRRHPDALQKLIDLGIPEELLPEPKGKNIESDRSKD